MFLFSTLALSILQTFACDGLDINSFITWYDCRFVTPYILAESDTVTICSLSPLANMSRVQCLLACVLVSWSHDPVACLKKIPIYKAPLYRSLWNRRFTKYIQSLEQDTHWQQLLVEFAKCGAAPFQHNYITPNPSKTAGLTWLFVASMVFK